MGTTEHAPDCEGSPRQTLSDVLARARVSADKSLRDRIGRYLGETGVVFRRGRQPRGRYCANCRDQPRYPDHHCAEHSMYLPAGEEARAVDSDPDLHLGIWREFFERVGVILKS